MRSIGRDAGIAVVVPACWPLDEEIEPGTTVVPLKPASSDDLEGPKVATSFGSVKRSFERRS
jgi:hypothetical protein